MNINDLLVEKIDILQNELKTANDKVCELTAEKENNKRVIDFLEKVIEGYKQADDANMERIQESINQLDEVTIFE